MAHWTTVILKGAATGLVAGIPQVLLTQAEARLLGLPASQADIGPRFVHRVGERLDSPPRAPVRWLVAAAFHFAYAAGWGVLYAAVQRWRPAQPHVGGPLLGALIYALAFSPWGAATQTGAEGPVDVRDTRETILHWTAALSFALTVAYLYARVQRSLWPQHPPARPPPQMKQYDAVVVGAGPNGLAAAIVLARAGLRVLLREAADTAGGGARTESLTLPGFQHDVCSAVHPLGIGSPFFRRLPLAAHGLEWIQPPAAVAHPFDDGSAALLERATTAMHAQIGADARAWQTLMDPFVARWLELFADALGPLKPPRHPLLLARFGLTALAPATWLARRAFRGERARALFAGMAAHATLDLSRPPSAAFGMILGIAGHAVGWPIPRGGSASITRALVAYFRALGGDLETGAPVASISDLPPSRAVLLDLTPRQILRLGGTDLPAGYCAALERYQYGLGTFKVDWALDAPIPWRAPEVKRAATVHLGGTLEAIDHGRRQEWAGQPAQYPYVLLVQPSVFDPSRAPAGKHVGWAYCHVPNGSTVDMTDRIEAQVERFAPGFRGRILARHTLSPGDLERHNPNLVGGDINGGEATLLQLFFRPTLRPIPYATPNPRLFICSSSTPPGGGVHGMGGYYAARLALLRRFAPVRSR